MTILIPDDNNLMEVEEKMTEADFKLLISPKMKAEEIEDDQVLVVEELVNVTLPIIDSTYVNHHLDKSLLMVSSFELFILNNKMHAVFDACHFR